MYMTSGRHIKLRYCSNQAMNKNNKNVRKAQEIATSVAGKKSLQLSHFVIRSHGRPGPSTYIFHDLY